MDPTLVEGDIIVWIPAKIEEINIGDIVIFKSYIKWPNEKLIAHRVTNIKFDKLTNNLILETKGDANKWKDQDNPYNQVPYIRDDYIQGKVIYFNNQPLKININFIVVLIVASIILLSLVLSFKFNNSKNNKFLFTTYFLKNNKI